MNGRGPWGHVVSMEDGRLHMKLHPAIIGSKKTFVWLDVLINNRAKQKKSINHASVIEKNLSILIFTAFLKSEK